MSPRVWNPNVEDLHEYILQLEARQLTAAAQAVLEAAVQWHRTFEVYQLSLGSRDLGIITVPGHLAPLYDAIRRYREAQG